MKPCRICANLSRSAAGVSLHETIASQKKTKSLTIACGLSWIIRHRPVNADSFSRLSRMLRMTWHHGTKKPSRCGETMSGQTTPSRPIVMATFSCSVRATGGRSGERQRTPLSGAKMAGAYGRMSLPICREISPSAHDALLHTDTCFGSRFRMRIGTNSVMNGFMYGKHEMARSPISAKADWRTSGAASGKYIRHWCSRLGSGGLHDTTSDSIEDPRPSARPLSRSSETTTKSLSGLSGRSASGGAVRRLSSYCCTWSSVPVMMRTQRSKTGTANGRNPLPMAMAMLLRLSSSGKSSWFVSGSCDHLCSSGGINLTISGSCPRCFPTESAKVPMASYKMTRFLFW
eukprot:Unigene7958_Nuclearia_a/m.24419 Unigene7958_Nuclearia_a/g.24419  ORF Unigene7958_Nuclearia_a/g.24419 Unigene7958_Nuclearia_a/m.24419 type:complete len:345 (-) Unigene7958_Nuclearia_a:1740-2774(-)